MPRRALLATLACLLAGALAPSAAPAASLQARAWISWEPDLGMVVSSHDANTELPMASTTKLMTALITLEHESLGTLLPVVPYPIDAGQSTIGLQSGERLTVADLLRAMLLPSADEAAQALAVDVGGSVPTFVGLMNEQASELNLTHTHYATPVGLDTPGNYSSAADLATLANFVLQRYSFLDRIVAEPKVTLHSGAHPRTIVNRNDLVGRYSYVIGVKTGHTNDAGYVLVGEARENGVRVISVVLGDPTIAARDADSLTLLRQGLDAFSTRTVVRRGPALATAAGRFRSRRVALVAARDVRLVVPRGAHVSVTLSDVAQRLQGPLPAGTHAGTVIVRENGRTVARVPLQTAAAVAKPTLGERLRNYVDRAVTIVLLLGVAACSLLLVGLRRRAVRRADADRVPA
jgi:D-alanyl-D-alanine carboxypeptidase (penicillin-binding protein 5/6)